MGLKLKYFVLKPEGEDLFAEASRQAMLAYARVIKSEDPDLYEELILWIDHERLKLGKDTSSYTDSGESIQGL